MGKSVNIERHEQKTFERENFSGKRPFEGELIACTFNACDFTKTNLAGISFVECVFNSCNFTSTNLKDTRLQHAKFKDSKLMGVDFTHCSNFLFAVTFEGCNLNYASFMRKKMKKTVFSDCTIQEANFSETDLGGATFDDCDLNNATFFRTNLEAADFRHARNFQIDPTQNTMKKAKFSRSGLAGLLAKFNLDIG